MASKTSMRKKGEKAYLETETGLELECLFNPEKFEVTLENSWSGQTKPGLQAPSQRFGGGESGKITGLELFFDTTDQGKPVTEYTDVLIKMLQIDPDLPGHDDQRHNGRPPWVRFHWGRFHSFRAVITRLNVSFVYFAADGQPLRARANLDLTQYQPEEDWPRQNPTSGTPTPARSHVIQPGETLDRIAAAHYDDPTNWRRVAAANGIKDPFTIRPGARVDVPTLED